MAYDVRPDQPELDQVVVYLERLADEYQTDHIDWGFRISALYGLDYRYTISRGLFSSQLLKYNEYYGYDMPMVYLELYIPWVFQGMDIRIGRYISLPDIEAQLAPNNPMYTHSLLYTFDPYTQEGIMTTVKLNKNWTIQLGYAEEPAQLRRRHDRAFLIWRHNLFAGQSRADIPVRGAQRPGPIFSLTKTPG